MNRRKSKRHRVRLRVKLEPGRVSSFSGDLSAGGLFIQASRVHRPGTPVRLVLHLPCGDVEAGGVVRWALRVPASLITQVRGGMGVQFTEIDSRLTTYLQAFEGSAHAEA